MGERVLIIGSGAREHALGWKISRDSKEDRELYFASGNGGTCHLGRNVDIDPQETDRLLAFAKDHKINFTIVGPEGPLAKGIVNAFREEDLAIFGQTKEAAVLESDKAEAVLFMRRHNIPHPESEIFTDSSKAESFIANRPWPEVVIKASGLAEGKGVVLPDSREEEIDTIRKMMIDEKFGDAGKKIVIQEKLKGIEASVIGFVSNKIGLLVPARDYKRACEKDKGPNTGGMGSYAPNDYLSQAQLSEIYQTILLPTKKGMEEEGKPLNGALYVGVMITGLGIKVIEYNVRFGDPETQVQMRLLQSDLLESMKATVDGKLNESHCKSNPGAAVGVVLASDGYPGKYEVDNRINGADNNYGDIVVFHAGTRIKNGELVSSGGRVLTVTATGETKEEASREIYGVLEKGEINLENGHFRRDIGN